MAETWVSVGGQFRQVEEMWVSAGGQFRRVEEGWVSAGGQFRESGVGDKPVLEHFYGQVNPVSGWAMTSINWSIRMKTFDAEQGDRVFFVATSTDGARRIASSEFSTISGVSSLNLNTPSTKWRIVLYLRWNGYDREMSAFEYTTPELPAPTDPAVSQVINSAGSVDLTLSWAQIPGGTSGYEITAYINSINPQTSTVPSAGASQRNSKTFQYLRENRNYGFYVRSMHNDGLRDFKSNGWAYISGTTIASYTPGVYEVEPVQKRTLIMGDKKTERGWRDSSDDKIYHGHGGDWNKHGTQVGFLFYWPDGVDPFQQIRQQIAQGARIARVSIRLHRAGDGNNVGIKPLVRTHGHKRFPGNDDLHDRLHDNWERTGDFVDVQETQWVELERGKGIRLISEDGNGIALGSTARKQEDYMAFWKAGTGKLRFHLE